jgi:hypothetical protein
VITKRFPTGGAPYRNNIFCWIRSQKEQSPEKINFFPYLGRKGNPNFFCGRHRNTEMGLPPPFAKRSDVGFKEALP